MTALDCHASESHYLDHVLPVWLALPRDTRRHLYVPRALAPRALAAGVGGDEVRVGRPTSRSPIPLLVASAKDMRAGRSRPVVLMEHGAGQMYQPEPGQRCSDAYAGGPGRRNVVLFLCPTQDVANANTAAYPGVPAVVTGPAWLDAQSRTRRSEVGSSSTPTVAVTFHWKCPLVPETWPAYDHYTPALPGFVADSRWVVLGHAHPRAEQWLRPAWERLGVEYEPELTAVVQRAHILVGDNTSALPEFAAATGRPVVWLNAPWYRRNVQHGGRFWRWPVGQVQCDDPEDLTASVELALSDPPDVQDARRAMVRDIYGPLLGGSAARAATAVVGVL